MKTSIWYHTADKSPPRSGYYLSYRGWGMGGKADSDCDHGYLWYDKRNDGWRDHQSGGHSAIVYYWTDATPDEWVENDPPITLRRRYKEEIHPAEQDAWDNLQRALEQYQTVKALCAKNEL